jgi:CBS domain-containing protein
MDLSETLQMELIRHLPLPEPIILSEETPITEAIHQMQLAHRGCVVIEKNGRLAGLVTERDILVKFLGDSSNRHLALNEIMTRSVETLPPNAPLSTAIQVMTRGGYRHIPLADAEGRIQGVVAARNIMDYIAEHFPAEVFNLPPRLEQKMESPEGA